MQANKSPGVKHMGAYTGIHPARYTFLESSNRMFIHKFKGQIEYKGLVYWSESVVLRHNQTSDARNRPQLTKGINPRIRIRLNKANATNLSTN